MFYGESEDITDVINKIVDERVNKAIQEANLPTGIKMDTYIVNQYTNLSAYDSATTMNGYTKENDSANKINNYLEYTEGKGYRVLKNGWYYVKMSTYIASVNPADVNSYFMVNENPMLEAKTWAGIGTLQGNKADNNTSIYLNEGDYIFFYSNSYGNTASEKTNWNCLYPMF